jgi:predicted amidohydrolase
VRDIRAPRAVPSPALMRVAIAQQDAVLGDVGANAALALRAIAEAHAAGAELLVFPELSLTGYALGADASALAIPADDPVLVELGAAAGTLDVVVGFVERTPDGSCNSAAYISRGVVGHVQRKTHLPTYSRWDEGRRFSAGDALQAFPTRFGTAAILICHDAWHPVLAMLAALDGADTLIVPAASGARGDNDELERDWATLLNHHARFTQVHIVFANRTGEENNARFWGGSRVVDPFGEVVAEGPRDVPALVVADLDPTAVARRRDEIPLLAHARLDLLASEFGRLGRRAPGR